MKFWASAIPRHQVQLCQHCFLVRRCLLDQPAAMLKLLVSLTVNVDTIPWKVTLSLSSAASEIISRRPCQPYNFKLLFPLNLSAPRCIAFSQYYTNNNGVENFQCLTWDEPAEDMKSQFKSSDAVARFSGFLTKHLRYFVKFRIFNYCVTVPVHELCEFRRPL